LRDVPVFAIVDDDESFRQALERFLGTFGFRLRTFASGEDFLQSGELGCVACLLLDLVMPGMSGLEVTQQLATRGLRIPTVFATAHADDEVKQHLVAAGAIAILPRPVDSECYFASCEEWWAGDEHALGPTREFDRAVALPMVAHGNRQGGSEVDLGKSDEGRQLPEAPTYSCLNPPSRTPSPHG
jgi:FixJ family two-component response regulator